MENRGKSFDNRNTKNTVIKQEAPVDQSHTHTHTADMLYLKTL